MGNLLNSEVGMRKRKKVRRREVERLGGWEAGRRWKVELGMPECGKERRCEYWRSEVGWLDD
jgi:hypothetical protein